MRKTFIKIILMPIMLMVGFALATEPEPIIAIVIASDQKAKGLKLTPKSLNLIYWRKQRYWPEGLPIKPVNLSSEHRLRKHFSKAVLGSTPQSQIDYWNGQYFNGILPPYSVDSEEAAIRYVLKTRGAIGYIDACKHDKRVKAVLWIVNHRIQKHRPELSCK